MSAGSSSEKKQYSVSIGDFFKFQRGETNLVRRQSRMRRPLVLHNHMPGRRDLLVSITSFEYTSSNLLDILRNSRHIRNILRLHIASWVRPYTGCKVPIRRLISLISTVFNVILGAQLALQNRMSYHLARPCITVLSGFSEYIR